MTRVGDGILFITMGAILAFGFNLDLGVVRLDVIGFIIMAAGVAYAAIGYRAQQRAEQALRESRDTAEPSDMPPPRTTRRTLRSGGRTRH